MVKTIPAGLSAREAASFALATLESLDVATAIAALKASGVTAGTRDLGPQGIRAFVVLQAGAGAEEYTSVGPSHHEALIAAINVAFFPPALDQAVEDLLGALDSAFIIAPVQDEAVRIYAAALDDCRAKARAALIHHRRPA